MRQKRVSFAKTFVRAKELILRLDGRRLVSLC
jgi:hypothetical protein